MHKFIFPTKDSWITDTTSSANYGSDQILEIKKDFVDNYTGSRVDGVSRDLIQFDVTSISASISSSDLPSNTQFKLKMYSTEPYNINSEYNLYAYMISQSWGEGTGRHGDNPNTVDGVTWSHRDMTDNNLTWSIDPDVNNIGSGSARTGSGGGVYYDDPAVHSVASQSFYYNSSDVDMDVTSIVNTWISGTLSNNGFLIKRPDAEEISADYREQLKFFSSNTHTIYSPKLETIWDDHVIATGSATGSLQELDMTGLVETHTYPIGFRPYYRESETVKFRFGCRKKYFTRNYSTTIQEDSGSFISDTSGSYSIVDLSTGEVVIPFDDYTLLSCDSTSNYFLQDLNTFSPDRLYKIMVKIKYNDGQERIFDDDNFTFKVRN